MDKRKKLIAVIAQTEDNSFHGKIMTNFERGVLADAIISAGYVRIDELTIDSIELGSMIMKRIQQWFDNPEADKDLFMYDKNFKKWILKDITPSIIKQKEAEE